MSSSTPEPSPKDPCTGPPTRRHVFAVSAAVEPSVLSRVVEMFVLRDLIPSAVRCDLIDDEQRLAIAVEITELPENQANHLVLRMQQFPTVIEVTLQTVVAAPALRIAT